MAETSCEKPLYVRWCPEEIEIPPDPCEATADLPDGPAVVYAAATGTGGPPQTTCPVPADTAGLDWCSPATVPALGQLVQQFAGLRRSADHQITVLKSLPLVGPVLAGILRASTSRLPGLVRLVGHCQAQPYLGLAALSSTLGFLEQWTGLRVPALRTWIDQTSNYLCPQKIPSQADVNSLRQREQLSAEQWVALTRANGNCPDWEGKTVWAGRLLSPPDQQTQLWMRGAISDDQHAERFTALGDFSGQVALDQRELAKAIPPPSDLIHFAVREAFTPELVQALDLNAEFPEAFAFWGAKQGIGWAVPGLSAGPSDPGPKSWAHAYWWSHWQLPSPTQAYEFVRRLRPGHVSPELATVVDPEDYQEKVAYAQAHPETHPHGIPPLDRVARLDLLLRANDYAPVWRGRLASVSYNPLTRVDIRRMYEVGVLTRQEVIEAYLDIGYTHANAERLAEFTVRLSSRTLSKLATRITRDKLLRAWRIGALDRGQVAALLERAGLQAREIELVLEAFQAEDLIARVDAGTKAVRRAYMAGAISDEEAFAQLERIGVIPDARQQLLQLWGLERTGGRKVLSAEKARDLYIRALISREELLLRLLNLGYGTRDAELIARTADQEITRKLGEAADAAEQARRDAQGRVTKTELVRWAREGIITPVEGRSRLRALGFLAADADRLIGEAIGEAVRPETNGQANGQAPSG